MEMQAVVEADLADSQITVGEETRIQSENFQKTMKTFQICKEVAKVGSLRWDHSKQKHSHLRQKRAGSDPAGKEQNNEDNDYYD